jgi:RNA polymerase sigma factor (sigma-70 family)
MGWFRRGSSGFPVTIAVWEAGCLSLPSTGYYPLRGTQPLTPARRAARKKQPWLRLAPDPSLPSGRSEPPLDDEALIEAVIRRDPRRAGELHDRLISVIEATLYRLFGRRERDHDDLVQATFEQIVVTLVRGRFARGCSLTTWASTVAAHVAFNTMRSNRRTQRVFDPVDASEAPDPCTQGNAETAAAVREQILLAQAHLAAMNPKRAMALILHDVLGHELAEIATMLQISSSAAQSRVVRGRRDFQERLKRDGLGKETHRGG